MVDYQVQAELFHLLSPENRLRILDELRHSDACVCHLQHNLKGPQAYVPQRLRILKDTGIVDTHEEGVDVFYCLTRIWAAGTNPGKSRVELRILPTEFQAAFAFLSVFLAARWLFLLLCLAAFITLPIIAHRSRLGGIPSTTFDLVTKKGSAMKILVTGGAGFIGSHVVDLMIEAGHDVVIADNLSTGRKSNLNPKARFYQVDIRGSELEQVFEVERPEVVDHHAGQLDVRRSVADPLYDADINVLGGLRVLVNAVKYGVRKIIYISSGGAVYGEPIYLPCDEKHPIAPLCPYGATKYMLELYLYMYQQTYGLDYSVIRYPNVYGPRQYSSGEAGVVAVFTRQMLANRPVTIFGTGEQVRDWVFVQDCARANLLLLNRGSGCVYNLGWGIGTTVNQLFQDLKEITGYTLEANHEPALKGETFRIYLDASRVKEELGWEPTVSLKEGLRKTVEHYQEKELDQ